MQRLGMEVYTSGPREFEEPGYNYVDFDSILPEVDIVMLLRVQHERHQNLMKLSKEEYHKLYLTLLTVICIITVNNKRDTTNSNIK